MRYSIPPSGGMYRCQCADTAPLRQNRTVETVRGFPGRIPLLRCSGDGNPATDPVLSRTGLPLGGDQQNPLHAPDHDKSQALRRHRKLLLMKRRQLDDMLRLVDETLGGITMQEQTISSHRADLEAVKKAYAREARMLGGTAAYQAFQAGHSGDTAEQERQLGHGLLEIFRAFHDCGAPEGPAAQALVERLQEYITRCYYPCSRDILASLGRLYTEDCRFGRPWSSAAPVRPSG